MLYECENYRKTSALLSEKHPIEVEGVVGIFVIFNMVSYQICFADSFIRELINEN